MWRLHRHRRRARALALLRRCIMRHVVRRRCRSQGCRMVHALSWSPAILIQRAYRRHALRVEACVALNFLQLRKMEPHYWARVVDVRETQLEALNAVLPPVPSRSMNVISPQEEPPTSRTTRRFTLNQELDVCSYALAGPLPEPLLRTELRKAIYVDLHRSARGAAPAHDEDDSVAAQDQGSLPQVVQQQLRVAVLLSAEVLTAILDNVCFVASEFQRKPLLRSHLRGRERMIVPY
ncbi:hypothetical protein STCU_11682 [Strigomonas culicis]|uniref:Uncharacterized protein n=1 Tax=Strigomonas culicis TaxID=28005 RepID=S9TD00_9TRYP|nr:hypothetical protein STCU_11682 [Strigomonas culicis]|eukprot:EPY15902.1 hypothetical protein STCU_11682 [Strigomonas culicis]